MSLAWILVGDTDKPRHESHVEKAARDRLVPSGWYRLETMLAETELRAFRGEKIVEIKPVWANKGEILESLLTAQPDPDFLFAVGNDRTDEDLFERISGNATWTVHVGPGPRAQHSSCLMLKAFAGYW